MHTAAKTTSETNSANTQTPEQALAHIKSVYRVKRLESELTMITAQTKAMEALIYCMTPLQSTGDSKLDAFYAKERNRQRLAAIQTLLHIRTVQREKRLRQSMRAKARAKAERLEPNRASDGSQATKQEIPTPSPPSPQRGRRWQPTEGRMTDEGAVDASPSRGGDHSTATTPSPLPQPTPPTEPPPPESRLDALRRKRDEQRARRRAEALEAEQNTQRSP